jgi:polar amino acid transport system permease protein
MLALEFDFGTVWEFLFNKQIVEGAWRTIQVAVIAQVIGIALGVAFALMRVARNPFAQVTAGFYVWVFRATPVLLQLFILYYGIPQLVDNREFTRELTAFRAAIIAFGINEGAYMTEIIRAGILSVESGQMDAGQSLGMTRLQTMRRIILPQAVRVIVPPTGNEFIAMLKNTSIASAISLVELLHATNLIYSTNFQIMELLVVAAIWYLAMVTVFSIGQAELERWLSIGERDRPQTLFSRALQITGSGRGT